MNNIINNKLSRTVTMILVVLCVLVPSAILIQSNEIDIEPALDIPSAWKDYGFEWLIGEIIDILFGFGLLLAPLLMIWGIFLAVTASGNVDQVSRAKNVIIWTLVGLVILLLSKGILDLVTKILGI